MTAILTSSTSQHRQRHMGWQRKWAFAVLSSALLAITPLRSSAQLTQEQCAQLLDKAMPGVGESERFAMTFEGICFGLDKPSSIFSQPVYKVFRGGYMYVEESRYEINLGMMKAMSDGKLMVVVDEMGKTMYVDSLTHGISEMQAADAPDMATALTNALGDAKITYLGKETVNGQPCHRLRTDTEGGEHSSHSLFWIQEQTGSLLLMADWTGEDYDTYWVKGVGLPPQGHDYSINLPNSEVEDFHGYKVMDLRFAARELYQQH